MSGIPKKPTDPKETKPVEEGDELPSKETSPSEGSVEDGSTPPVIAVGRIVHYVTSSGSTRPAIIAGVLDDGVVDVVVFNSTGAQFVETVFDDKFPGETPGTVFWPEIH